MKVFFGQVLRTARLGALELGTTDADVDYATAAFARIVHIQRVFE